MVCLKFLWTDRVWILCFSDLHSVIYGFWLCFMAEIVVFYNFVHFVGKIDFVAEPHNIYIYTHTHTPDSTRLFDHVYYVGR
ncbi:hypothetical protein Hanom_Chr16g01502711 [Helianthus anomalus]